MKIHAKHRLSATDWPTVGPLGLNGTYSTIFRGRPTANKFVQYLESVGAKDVLTGRRGDEYLISWNKTFVDVADWKRKGFPVQASMRLVAGPSMVRLDKYVPDAEAHAKLPLPKGKWKQVQRNYMRTNRYEVQTKDEKLLNVVQFYEKLGYKVKERLAPGETDESWGASVVKMKAPTPDHRLTLSYDHHNKITVIEFTMINKASKVHAGRATGEGAGALFYALDTQKFLVLLRADDGDDGNCWCCLGGGRDMVNGQPEPLEMTVRREAFEEGGLAMDAEYELIHVGTKRYEDGFKFYNYLALIEEEFLPIINEEHKSFQWVDWDKLPKEMHRGMMSVFNSPHGQKVLKTHTTAFDGLS